MRATVVDLRYHMRDVLKALARKEAVSVLCHGKLAGVITPAGQSAGNPVASHPFFGMQPSGEAPAKVMERLRDGRYRAV